MQIQRFPQGLLTLLGNTSGGVTPSAYSQVLATTIDTSELYLANIGLSFDSVAIGAAAVTGAITYSNPIPPGEIWFVRNITLNSSPPGVGITVRWRPFIQFGSNLSAGPDSVSAAPAERLLLGWELNRYFSSGTRFGVYQESINGAGVGGNIYVAYHRLVA